MTGGGTGGHITPLLAVAHEIKRINPSVELIYIGERNGKYSQLIDNNKDIDQRFSIFAGKYRRYHGESFLTKITDFRTILLNFRDFFYAIIGIVQSIFLLRIIKPNIIFLKGGFVGVPVGLAGAFWGTRMVTHDSDAIPGLANRITGRWTDIHATAMSKENYSYDPDKVIEVGVLVGPQYKYVDNKLKQQYRKELGLDSNGRILMITGGSNGALNINKEIAKFAPEMLEKHPKLIIIHQAGKGKLDVYGNYENSRLKKYELLENMYMYSGASDLIVSRAGANTIAEFGVQSKTCVVVPNPLLTGGHQTLNAKYLADNDAAMIVEESSLGNEHKSKLWDGIELLLFKNSELAKKYAHKLHEITKKDAATKLAKILIEDNSNEI